MRANGAIDWEGWFTWAAIGAGLYILWRAWQDQAASEASAFDYMPAPGTPLPEPSQPRGAQGTTQAPAPGLPFMPAPPAESLGSELLNVVVPQTTSPAGQAFIKNQEGWTAIPKSDAGGFEIGWGHRIKPGENFPRPITQAGIGSDLFDADLSAVETMIQENVTAPINQNQFDALADLGYNVQVALSPNSSVVKALNAGNYAGAAANIALYNKSQGRVNPVLVKRRQAEQSLFNQGRQ